MMQTAERTAPTRSDTGILDSKALRSALACFATGVCVVTTQSPEKVDVGVTVNSFTSVSLSPPLILWSLAKSSSALEAFRQGEHFVVHVLAADQEHLSTRFASRGIDRFAGVPIQRNLEGVPVLDHSAARFECRVAHQYEGGDHLIFVGEVLRFQADAAQPLVFHGGGYTEVAAMPSPLPPGNREGCLVTTDLSYLIWRAFMQFRRRHYERRVGLGWSESDAYILQILAMDEGQTVSELAEAISFTGERCNPECIRNLVQRGLVEAECPVGPATCLKLTDISRCSVRELSALARTAEGELLGKMTATEGRRLKHVLGLMIESMCCNVEGASA
ncbi:p-hydroxyphenylacetate 3-hydroxylase, reductase component (plasmid) [Variovorax sp. SRS16]|uniref:flavin reductase n=1 Tax=Variovorax sp. SRS16 TaxID=282217 RepID=UPI001315DC14|nr:flavin reductase [Variovorax sp. SRS16]VTU46466.1 p-hydroxyphenylacetate 3-hydroxylase, reductase component [Variovorax sp. SRS16]